MLIFEDLFYKNCRQLIYENTVGREPAYVVERNGDGIL